MDFNGGIGLNKIWNRAVQNQIVGGLDPEYLAYETAMSVPPSTEWQTAANQLFVDLKAALGVVNLTDALDFAYILAAETAQAALLNMVNPETYNATNVNAMAFEASRGFTGASGKYLNTNYNPAVNGVNYTDSSACIGIYSRIDASINGYDIGVSDGVNQSYIQSRVSGNFGGALNDGVGLSFAVASSLSLITLDRPTNNLLNVYQAGGLIGFDNIALATIPSQMIYIGVLNNNGSPFFYSTRQFSFSFSGRSMDATEQANLYTTVQAFMTAIGADV